MNPTVVALLVSHDGSPVAAGRDRRACAPDRARDAASSRVDTGSKDEQRRPAARRLRRGRHRPRPYGVPRGGADRPRAGRRRRRRRVGLAAPRRQQPRPRRARAAAGGGRRRPATPTILGPKLREWPSLSGCSRSGSRSPAPAGARPASSPVSTTRASTTRSTTCSRSTPPACWSAAGCSTSSAASTSKLPMFGNDIDFGWRAARAGLRTVVVPQAVVFHAEAAHRGQPAYAADRAAHPLPGAPGGALHAARQRPGREAAVAGRPALLRHAAADARVPRASARPARRSTSWRRCSPSTPAPARSGAPARHAGRRRRPRTTPPAALAAGGCPTGTASTSSATSPPRLTNQAQDVADRRRAAKEADAPAPIRRPVGRRRRRGAAEDTGLVARFFTSPLAAGDHPGGAAVALRRARGVRHGHRRRPLARRPPRRRPLAALDRVVAPARAPAPPSRARRTSCRWRCSAGCWAAAPAAASRRCCCSPYRWRCGAPGGCSAWSAGWSTPAARRAGWSVRAPSPTRWCR